jgi:hypothetical protein
MLQNVVDGRAEQLPHHLTGVLLNVFPVLPLKLNNARAVQKFRAGDVCIALAIRGAVESRNDALGQVVQISYAHD